MRKVPSMRRLPTFWIDPSLPTPYPGARPLRGAEEATLLIDRDDFARNLIDDVADKRVVELTADSGVGKSSLLDTRVVPALREAGALVIMVRSWGTIADEPVGAANTELYASVLRRALDEGAEPAIEGVDGLTGVELIEELDRRLGAGLVIIFDQLEELFRDNSTIGRRFVAAIAEQAIDREFHHIVSLRSEYKVGLELIERRVPPELWRWHPLPALGDSAVPDVITKPASISSTAPRFSYAPEAVNAVSLWWTTARAHSSQIGLLHLQAYLWMLWQRARPAADEVITLDVIDEHWLSLPRDTEETDPERCVLLFTIALIEYVEGRLGGGSTTASALERERLFTMARIAPHLSSTGYKLVRELGELANLSIEGFNDLWLPDDFLHEAVRAAHRQEASGPDGLVDGETLFGTLSSKFDDLEGQGDHAIPAGRMRGSSPASTACEMVASFESALRLLTRESIIRITPSADDVYRVSLVHDGFGLALDSWSDKVSESPMMTLDALTTITARQLFKRTNNFGDRALAGDQPLRFGPRGTHLANGVDSIANVNWVSCYVTAEFENVHFTNCNLSSTLFRKCRFTNVTFTNCQMWGTLFQKCAFAGSDGVRIQGPASVIIDGEAVDGMKSLTFDRCEFSDGGIAVEGVRGYGLIFDKCGGGPWKVVRSDLMHAMFDIAATRPEEAGSIEDCERILYFSSSQRTSEPPTIKNSTEVGYFNVGAWQVDP